MKVSVTIFVILISTCIVNASVLDPVIENVVHLKATVPPSGVSGIWKKKTIWKPRWVKEWKSAKVMKPVWRKVWSPIQIKEWVPIPKPPPGWDSVSTPLKPVTDTPVFIPPKQPHHLKRRPQPPPQPIQQTIPLWDPVPYPESQQPPPPPPFPPVPVTSSASSLPFYPPCGNHGCGDPPTFNRQQILEIINSHKHKKSVNYNQSPEYSETVTHLTRVAPNGNPNWPPPQRPNFFADNHLNLPELSPFLVPPKFRPLPDNNFLNSQFRNQPHQQNFQSFNKNRPNSNVQITHSLGFEINPIQNNKPRPWNPLPHQSTNNNNNNKNNRNNNNNNNSNNIINNNNNNIINNNQQNNIRGHFITKAPDTPHKFQQQETTIPPSINSSKNANSDKIPNKESNEQQNLTNQPADRPIIETDFIQPAELVGEYHYSDFDLTKKVNLEPKKTEEQNIKHQFKKPHPHQNPPKPQEPRKNISAGVENKPRLIRTDNGPSQPAPKEETKPDLQTSGPTFQPEKKLSEDVFPIFRATEDIKPTNFPSNHRFAPLRDNKLFKESSPQNNNTSKTIIQTETFFHFQPPSSQQPEEPTTTATVKVNNAEKENHINSDDFTETSESETSTPFTVYPSSSFAATSEPETEGPVFIVTPSYTIKT